MTKQLAETPAPTRALAPGRAWQLHVCAWLGLLALSLVLLFYPVHPTLDYAPIQATTAIPHLTLFAILFYVWFAILVGLLLLQGESLWQHLVLLVILTSVTQGVWILETQGHIREAVLYATMVDYLKEGNRVAPGIESFGYFSWPGSFLLATVVSQVASLSTWSALVALQLAWNGVFAILLYLLFLRTTKSPTLAWLGTLLILVGSIQTAKLMQQFHPGTLGMVLFVLALFLLQRGDERDRNVLSGRFSFLLALSAMCIVHFVSSVTLMLVLASRAVVAGLARHRLFLGNLIMLSAVLVVAWLIFYATGPFAGLTAVGKASLGELFSDGIRPSSYFRALSRNYVGGEAPLWGAIIRYAWILVLYLAGAVLALVALLRIRRLGLAEQGALGLAIGVGAQGVISFASGEGNIIRFFTFAPIPFMMLVLIWLTTLSARARKLVLSVTIALLLALSLPSFLANNNSINLNAFNRPTEQGVGKLLAGSYGKGQGVTVFGQTIPWQSFIPFAGYRYPFPSYLPEFTPGAFANEMRAEAEVFSQRPIAPGEKWVWMKSERDILDGRYVLGADLEALSGWRSMEELLGNQNKIYDNKEIQVFFRE